MMGRLARKRTQRSKRHKRIRAKIEGTPERPRLSVYKSLKHIYAQIINDWAGETLVAASTLEDEIAADLDSTCTIEAAKAVGRAIGERALAEGIEEAVFDRSGWPMHGKIRALAEG
ncbi:MAG: 50S ribosomal protein L18, partial [Armatimonadota bacterium]